MSWFVIKYRWFWGSFALTLIVNLGALYSRYNLIGDSYIWSMDGAISGTLVTAPILAGTAAAAMRLTSRRFDIIQSFPTYGRLKAVMHDPLAIFSGGALAFLFSAIVVTLNALANGYVVSAAAWDPILPALLHVFTFVILGTATAIVFPYLLTAPVLSIFLFSTYLFGFTPLANLNDYLGATVEWYGQSRYTTEGMIGLVTAFVLVAIGSFIIVFSHVNDIAKLGPSGFLILGIAAVLLAFQNNVPMFEDRPEAHQHCKHVADTGLQFCVVPEISPRLDDIVTQVSQPLQRLHTLGMDVDHRTLYIPGDVSARIFSDSSQPDDIVIANLIGGLTCRAHPAWNLQKEEQLIALTQKLLAAEETLALWAVEASDVDQGQAEDALNVVQDICEDFG